VSAFVVSALSSAVRDRTPMHGYAAPRKSKLMSGWQKICVVISILWLIASPAYLLVTKNQAANKSYATCIESSLMTGTRLRYIGQHDQADAWERHSKDWCLEPLDTCRRLAWLTLCWREATIAPSCGVFCWGQSRCCGLSEDS